MTGRKIALLSVSDKREIVSFAKGLVELGFTVVSTGGTLRHLQQGGVAVTPVDEVTGFPEMLDGRVKTLHPRIHGGVLAVRDDPDHRDALQTHDIAPIDVVCVNLYPFEKTVARSDSTWEEGIENIDIGGPTLLRAAAKNHAHVWVVSDPEDYGPVLAALRAEAQAAGDGHGPDDGSDSGADEVENSQDGGSALRRSLATRAFQHTAAYDQAIAAWFVTEAGDAPGASNELPAELLLPLRKVEELRYGENPHQRAAFYAVPSGQGEEVETGILPTIADAQQLGGKQLSFNNINDADAALRLVLEFGVPAAVAVKHTNPCGVGIGPDVATAFERAFRADDVSIFGGIVAFNRAVDVATAQLLSSIFLEVIIAPAFEEDALEILQRKSNLRLLETGFWPGTDAGYTNLARTDEYSEGEGGAGSLAFHSYDYKRVAGGLLIQSPDPLGLERGEWRLVTTVTPTEQVRRQLEFAWLVGKHVKSNAIVLAKDDMTVGVGAGQTNRIDATRHAIERAALVKGNPDGARGAVLASDAFFPFPDVVEAAAAAGIVAIVQPGGSMRDSASIEAANRAGMAMYFTGKRHFKH